MTWNGHFQSQYCFYIVLIFFINITSIFENLQKHLKCKNTEIFPKNINAGHLLTCACDAKHLQFLVAYRRWKIVKLTPKYAKSADIPYAFCYLI